MRNSLITRMTLMLGVLVLTVGLAIAGLGYRETRQAVQAQQEQRFQAIAHAFMVELERAEQAILIGVHSVAANPEIQAAFARGDRERLQDLTEHSWPRLSELGISQYQFHVPPATSFFRVHMPKKFGDDLSSFRNTVVVANQERRTVTGLEAGVAGFGIRAVVPVTYEGRHVGTVEYGYSFDDWILKTLQETYAGDYFLYSRLDDTKLLAGTGVTDQWPATADQVKEVLEQQRMVTTAVGGDKVMALIPFRDFQGEVVGYLKVVAPAATASAAFREQMGELLVVLVILLLGGLLTTYLVLRRALRPLQLLQRAMAEVAAGNLTVTAPDTDVEDEIGQITRSFNQMVRQLRQVARQVNQSAQSLLEASTSLARSSEETGRAAQNTARSAAEVSNGAQEQARAAGTVQKIMDQAYQAVQEVARGSQQAATEVQNATQLLEVASTSLSAMAEEAGGVAERSEAAARTARQGGQVVDETVAGLKRLTEAVGESAARMNHLQQSMNRIGEMTDAISQIADQTNLLALNAAIEAARAGEQGRGFAVVAEEVRRLAERSARSAREIAELVQDIQLRTTETVESMTASLAEAEGGSARAAATARALADILSAVEAMSRDVRAIATRVGEVRSRNQGVVNAFATVAAVTEESTAATEEMAAGTTEVSQSVEQIASAAQSNAAATEEALAAVEELTAAAQEVATAAQHLQQIARDLQDQVGMFRVD